MRLLALISIWNVPQEAIDVVASMYVDSHLNKVQFRSNFYHAKMLVLSMLGLRSHQICCCVSGCMLYYKDNIVKIKNLVFVTNQDMFLV